jgi:hypothetical protein
LPDKNNLRQWGMVFALYTEDSGGRFPSDVGSAVSLLRGSVMNADEPNIPRVWHGVDNRGIARCPAAARPGDNRTFSIWLPIAGSSGWQTVRGTCGSAFEAWEVTSPDPPFGRSYGFNERLFSEVLIRHTLSGRVELDMYPIKGKDTIPVLLDCTAPSTTTLRKLKRT